MGLGAGAAGTGAALGPWGMAAMLGASLAGPVISAMFAPEGQELKSFSGTGVDPVDMMTNLRRVLGELGNEMSNRANTPVSLPSAYVQQPGAYSGGTLPMPIGVVGSDPALANPSLLNLPGMGEFESLSRLFNTLGEGASGPSGDGQPNAVTPEGYNDGPDPTLAPDARMAVPKATPSAPPLGPQRRPFHSDDSDGGQLVRAGDLFASDFDPAGDTSPNLAGSGDDLDQGLGAVTVLLESLNAMRQPPRVAHARL